mgnify:CR=1 FL=1
MAQTFGTSEQPQTLGELDSYPDSSAKTFVALMGENLGHRTLKFSFPIAQFIDISAVGNRKNIEETEAFKGEYHAQRNLIREHAVGLGRYTLMGLVRSQIRELKKQGKSPSDEIIQIRESLGNPAYASLQPIVTNIRNCEPGGGNIPAVDIGASMGQTTGVFSVTLSQQNLLWVVDGQHRREGFDMVLDFLRKIRNTMRYPKRGLFDPSPSNPEIMSEQVHAFWMSIYEMAISRATVSVECHLGLSENEEQQLFFDLNSKGRKVTKGLAYQYDHTDPINKFVSEQLIDGEILPFKPSEKDVSDWKKDEGSITRKDVNTVTCLLCLGKGTSKSATPALLNQRRAFLEKFWEAIVNVPHFGEPGAKANTVLAQPVVLKAIAKLAHDLCFGHQNIRDRKGYEKLYAGLRSGELDFSHGNEMWTALMLSNEQRKSKFPGIEKFVFVPAETNLDAGVIDKTNNWVRFGSKHNDIFPRLGDTIRWRLKLAPRPSVAKAFAEKADA